MDRKPGLAWITFGAVSATEFTSIAAECGCGSVALLGHAPAPGVGRPIAVHEVDAIRALLADNAMVVSSLDILPITPAFDPADADALLEMGAALGAQRIGTVLFDPDLERGAANLRLFASRARAHGLQTCVEFVSFSPLRSFADAVCLIDLVDDPSVKITFDILHFVRGGGTLEELSEASVEKIGYVQICDGLQTMQPERLMWEAGSQRIIPGKGSFDLAGIFSRLPSSLVIDIEAPMADLTSQGVAPLAQARLLVSETTALLSRIQSNRSG